MLDDGGGSKMLFIVAGRVARIEYVAVVFGLDRFVKRIEAIDQFLSSVSYLAPQFSRLLGREISVWMCSHIHSALPLCMRKSCTRGSESLSIYFADGRCSAANQQQRRALRGRPGERGPNRATYFDLIFAFDNAMCKCGCSSVEATNTGPATGRSYAVG